MEMVGNGGSALFCPVVRGGGPAGAVAYNPQATIAEQRDAGSELMSGYLADGLQFYLPDMAAQVRDMQRLRRAEEVGDRLLLKALRMVNPEAAEAKARTEGMLSRVSPLGFLQKPGMPFDQLRRLSRTVEVARAIHQTRMRQVAKFATPQHKDDLPGFRIVPTDPEAEMGADQVAYVQWLTKFLLNGGRNFSPRSRRRDGRKPFKNFLRELTDESLMHDNVSIELVPLRRFPGLDAFYLRDGATFYYAGPESEHFACQMVDGMPSEWFHADELAIFSRNTSPAIDSVGYGRSELESSLETITLFLQAMEYTRQGIDQNAIPKGILTVYGQFDLKTQEQFRNAWNARLRGVGNRWGLPVLFSRNGQAASQFTPTNVDFSEMAFAKWIGLQVSIMSGIYGIDPKEIHFDGFSSQNTSALGGSDTGEKLQYAKDSGRDALLGDVEGFVSDELIGAFTPNYRMTFTGLDPMEAKAKREREEKVSTIDELRSSLGKPPHPIAWIGDLPADATILSAEGDRIAKVATLNEGRRIYGLPEYPDQLLGSAPLNPNLGALYNQITAPEPPAPAPGVDPFGDFQGGDEEDDPEGEEARYEAERRHEVGDEPSQLHQDLANGLRSLKGGGEDQ